MATGSRIFQMPEHLRPADVEKLKFIEEIMGEAGSVQEKVLEEILARNGETEYLKRLGLDVTTDAKTFKEKVPLITYEDMKPDVQRIADGDRSPILTSQPVVQFLTSSGTSAGVRKLFPVTQEELDRRFYIWSLMVPIVNCYVPDLDKGKALYFYFVKSEIKTRGGIPAMPVLTSYYKSEAFRSRPYDPYSVFTSPTEAILCPDAFQSMYVQMLCGLYQRKEVLRIGAIFASSLLRAIRFLQVNWEDLAHDIALGTLNDKITDESVRSCGSIVGLLKPDLELAEFIRKECSCGNWEGIVRRIWPNTKYLDVIITGPMGQYISTLESYSGGLPMASSIYASSECYFGLNLRPICKPSEVSYTLFPNMAYFEFLPHGSGSDKADLVDLVDVEVGKEYEIVVTTHSGLYRYQVGDILRATGYQNAAPQFEFVRRKNVLLSIESDKTNEVELQNAVKYASELLNNYDASVMEYTSRVDTSTIPAHYVIYWELTTKESSKLKPEGDVIEKCCLAIEDKLNSVYRQGRVETKSIGPLEIRVVRAGTFEELMDFALSKTASFNQYKVPRCVDSNPLIELLESNVVSKHFSPSLPTGKTLC